ncbi:MAG: EscN/YscN/HrcN family type III secretion system ATPase, partial [Pirellulales bacterium]
MHATLDSLREQLRQCLPTGLCGSVVRTSGMTAEVAGFPAPVRALVAIEPQGGGPLAAEVIGFHDDLTLVYLLDNVQGLRHGNRVRLVKTSRWIKVGGGLLGRVINAHGQAIDGRPQPALLDRTPLERPAPAPVARPRIDAPLYTGVGAIAGLLTSGNGQRMG